MVALAETVTRWRTSIRHSIQFASSSGRSHPRVEQVCTRTFPNMNWLSILVDIYCYACNDARLDPELTTHLAAFGINVTSQKKTEKSMTELVRYYLEDSVQNTYSVCSKSNKI